MVSRKIIAAHSLPAGSLYIALRCRSACLSPALVDGCYMRVTRRERAIVGALLCEYRDVRSALAWEKERERKREKVRKTESEIAK